MAQLKSTVVQGNLTASGQVLADKLIKNGGTDSQILMGDGSTLNKSTFYTSSSASSLEGRVTTLENTTVPGINNKLQGLLNGKNTNGTEYTAYKTLNLTSLNSKISTNTGNISTNATNISNLSSTLNKKVSDLNSAITARVKIDGDVMTGILTMCSENSDDADLTIKTPSISLTKSYKDSGIKAKYSYNSLDDCVELSFT